MFSFRFYQRTHFPSDQQAYCFAYGISLVVTLNFISPTSLPFFSSVDYSLIGVGRFLHLSEFINILVHSLNNPFITFAPGECTISWEAVSYFILPRFG